MRSSQVPAELRRVTCKNASLQDCPAMYLLEALAVDAGLPTTQQLLQNVGNAPVLASFAPRIYQGDNCWELKNSAAVDPLMN